MSGRPFAICLRRLRQKAGNLSARSFVFADMRILADRYVTEVTNHKRFTTVASPALRPVLELCVNFFTAAAAVDELDQIPELAANLLKHGQRYVLPVRIGLDL